jgi:hypothetical protein
VKLIPTRETLRDARRKIQGEATPNRKQRRAMRYSEGNATGLKMWLIPGTEDLTPYARKELKRRRAAGKVAKAARKVNRRLRRTGGRHGV